MNRILDPQKIESKSFRIIENLLASSGLSGPEKAVVKRVIHATTDLVYAKELYFHPQAIKVGLSAIKAGCNIICDVSMVKAGINEKILASFSGKAICFINDKNVIKQAARLKLARAILSMRKAGKSMDGAIVAIGNAPTALFEVCNLVRAGEVKPALIVGIPVGFVGAVEAKNELVSLGVPCITNNSTRGGSSVAAAIVNALLKLAAEEK